MYSVYILYSEKDGQLYVGCTSDIENRIQRHNSGQVMATAARRPLICIHTETYLSKTEAFNRERFFKTLWSSRFKNKIKKEYLSNKQSK